MSKTRQTARLSASERAELFLEDLEDIVAANFASAWRRLDVQKLSEARVLESVAVNLRAAVQDLQA